MNRGSAADRSAQDQMWLVSSRSAGCGPLTEQVEHLEYWHYEPGGGWVHSDLPAPTATDSNDATTVIFVHGNRFEYSDAFTKGLEAYQLLISCA